MDFSSDPSSTQYSDAEKDIKEAENPEVEQDEKEKQEDIKEEDSEIEEKDKKGKILTITLIVFVDILIPLMLILSAISCMSIMGMLFVILLYVHIFICNAVKDNFKKCRTCLIVDFVINFIVFVFAIVRYAHEIKDEWIKIVGLDFDNIISSTPNFTLATSLIAMICQIVSLVLISKLSYENTKDSIPGVERFCETRKKVFSLQGVMFGFDFVWAVCNAFNAASNCCYLYLPILLFFVISNITQSVCGRNLVPPKVTLVIMGYSLLFGLFELYMVSYIGEKYDPSSGLKYNYIASDSTKGVNVVIAVLFAYISAQNLSAPGLSNGGAPKPVPKALKSISDWILIIAFVCTFIFAMFYPNYLSVLWMLIPAIASFVKFPTLRKLLFPLLTIVFTLSFVSQALTTFYLFDPPKDDGVERRIEFCRLFGLYRYPNDFTFTACGFFIIMLLGQIGKITHVSTAEKKIKEVVEEKPLLDFEEEEELDEEELRAREKERKKEEARKKRQEEIQKIKKTMKKIWHVIYKAFSLISVAAIVIIGITIGFYRNRFAHKILCCLFIIIVNLALYNKPVFEFIKIVSALMSMIACFYKTTINEDCLNPDDCLIYLKWDNIPDMVRTGLVAPPDMSLAEFNWPIAVIFALSTFLTADPKALNIQLPSFIASAIFIIVAFLHFLYVFLYDTNIFSLIFLVVGIVMITSQYLQKRTILALSGCISCIFVSAQLIIFLLSHFDNVRNMISSLIDESVCNLTKIYGPDFEICLLAAILFCSTIAFNTGKSGKMNYFLDAVFYEIRVIMDLFYFYLCWVFIFLFCIVNNNASLIKFILMLFFAFGRWSEPIFYKIRIPFLIFNVLYLCAQFAMHVFNVDDNTKRYYSICQFVGLYFTAPNKPTKGERNLSVLYQLIVVVLGVVNAKAYQRRLTDPKFDRLLSTRVYNAICAMLHHWLDIIIQISLCTSTLFNPSLFGWFSFVVMVLVNYNEKAMQDGANAITVIFNICLIIQYLLFLGYPLEAFGVPDKKPNIVDLVNGEANKERLRDWLRWMGVYDVKVAQLTSNCISAFFFTFYLTWHNTFVDYDQRFDALPHIMRELVNWYTTYAYEIMLSLIIIVSSFVRSIDGCLFFILSSILLLCSILMNYPKFRALNIMSIATFVVIAFRLLARLPIFTEEDVGIWIKKAFDLPLGGESKYENLWIIIYALERLTIHIMKSKIYKECIEKHQMHQAFRYIRSRQICNLEKLDQDILNQKHIIEIELIRKMQGNVAKDIDDQVESGKNKNEQKTQGQGSDDHVNESGSGQNNENDNEEEEDLNQILQKRKKESRNFFSKFIHQCGINLIKLLAGSLHLNSESGINVLTLDSLTTLMIKVLRTYETLVPYQPNETELEFFQSLPPSFPLHFQTIADIVNYNIIDESNYKRYLKTYIFMFLRRISLPLLTFMILIYMFIKPYLFSMIVIVIFCCLILPLDIKGYPVIYRVYLALVMFLFALRNICTLDILESYILDANDSITIQKMSISIIKMFGIDPEDNSTIEIFLFLFSVFFVVDQLQWCEIFPPKYYYNKFVKENPGFPMEYCYGIMNDPVVTLKMNQRKPIPFLKQFKYTMCKAGLIETVHSTVMLIIDTISFILLLILWGMWTHGKEGNSADDSVSYVFLIDVAYVFILLIHVCFSLMCYAFSLSSNHIGLYITNVVWFLYTYCICNFFLYSRMGMIDSSLQFYIFVRFIWHLIAEHKCFRGRRIVAFKYPNFQRDWRLIYGFNKFIRIIPFVFEVQTILIWMSQKTKVKLLEFFVIRDAQMQIENTICRQTNPKFKKPIRRQSTELKGGLLLLVFAIILFVPLFFMSISSPDKSGNPPLSATLEIGFSSFPSVFMCNGEIIKISKGIQQDIADTNIASLNFLVLANTEEVTIIDFPRLSFVSFDPSPELLSFINSNIRSNTSIIPFYRLSLFFDKPTTKASVNQIIYQQSLPDLDRNDRHILQQMVAQNTTEILGYFKVPLIITVALDLNPGKIDGIDRDIGLELVVATDEGAFELAFPDAGYPNLPILSTDNSYRIILYSQKASDSSNSLISTDPSTIGIYLLIIVTLGVTLRYFSLTLTDDLWLERMNNPIKIYKMFIAVNAFRAARDTDKEKEMADQLLNTLRSREVCNQMTK